MALTRKSSVLVVLVLTAFAVVGMTLAARPDRSETPGPTIELVARGMTFYRPGDSTPNPRLQVEPGARVTIRLRNEEAGIPHDVAVPTLAVGSPLARTLGATAEISFRAPDEPGEHEYVCSQHAAMMRGVLDVR